MQFLISLILHMENLPTVACREFPKKDAIAQSPCPSFSSRRLVDLPLSASPNRGDSTETREKFNRNTFLHSKRPRFFYRDLRNSRKCLHLNVFILIECKKPVYEN